MAVYLQGVADEAIATDTVCRNELTFRRSAVTDILKLQSAAADEENTAELAEKLTAAHAESATAEEAVQASGRGLQLAMDLLNQHKQSQTVAKATAADFSFIQALQDTSISREMADTRPSLMTTAQGCTPDGIKLLQEYAGFLATPRSFEERQEEESPLGKLRHGLGAYPDRSRIVPTETTAKTQALFEKYVLALHAKTRKKSHADSPSLDEEGKTGYDQGLQGDQLTRGGLRKLYETTQLGCKFNLSDQGQLTPAMIRHAMSERMLSSASVFQLAGGRTPAMISSVSTWTATASALQLAVTRKAHQSDSKDGMSGTTAMVLYDRHMAIIKAAFSAKRFQLHRVTTLVQEDGSPVVAESSPAMLWAFEAYRRDRIKQEQWIASRLRTHVLQKLQEGGCTETELRRAFVLFWRIRMHFKTVVLHAGHQLYAVEFIRKGTVPTMLDAMLKIKPLETPLTGV